MEPTLSNLAVVGLASIAVGVCAFVVRAALAARQVRTRRSRGPAESESVFVRKCQEKGIPELVARAVSGELRRALFLSDLPVRLEDDLELDHQLDNENLNDLVESLAGELHREFHRSDMQW